MNKQFKRISAVLSIALMSVVNLSAKSIDNGSSLSETKTREFVTFASKQNKQIFKRKTKELSHYLAVLGDYQYAGVKFFNMDAKEQESFQRAADELIKVLESSKKEEAKMWAKDIRLKAGIFDFIWGGRIQEEPAQMDLFLVK